VGQGGHHLRVEFAGNSDQATLFLFSINVTHHRIKMLLVGPLEVDRLLHAEPLLIYTRVAKVLVDGLVARPGSLEVAMHAIGRSHAADRANQLAAVALTLGVGSTANSATYQCGRVCCSWSCFITFCTHFARLLIDCSALFRSGAYSLDA